MAEPNAKQIQWNLDLTNLCIYNEVLGITNDFHQPAKITIKCMEPNLDTTNLDLTYKIPTGYNEQNPETQT